MAREPSRRPASPEADASALLAWYDRHRRDLPWRSPPGLAPDPYAVWLSEVMLQQTTVTAVRGYYSAFLAAWPTVEALAAAPAEDVMRAWAGLGYYSRARNLHACAKRIAAAGGRFSDTEPGLRMLPGIGAYTAAAIASIAFGRRAVVVDGNVERVIVRLHAISTPIRESRPEIRRHADARTPRARCGDYAQAMMDLGATICTPRRPACVLCPLADGCAARQAGRQDAIPVKAAKAERVERAGSSFYVRCGARVLVRTRPDKGLLGGMTEFPGSPWTPEGDPRGAQRPIEAEFRRAPGEVEHGFTHLTLRLAVFAAVVPAHTQAPAGCRWVPETTLSTEALPTLMRKVAAAGSAVLDDAPSSRRQTKRNLVGAPS